MFRFFAMIAVAVAAFIVAALNTAVTCLAAIEQAIKRLLGGGGAEPAMPEKDIQQALPKADEIKKAQDLEIGKAKAADHIRKLSPVMQVKMFASMTDDEKLSADLSLLTPDQMEWLLNMSDEQLKEIASTSDRRIAGALAGTRNMIAAIGSVGQEDEMKTAIGHRIDAYRMRKSDPMLVSYSIN